MTRARGQPSATHIAADFPCQVEMTMGVSGLKESADIDVWIRWHLPRDASCRAYCRWSRAEAPTARWAFAEYSVAIAFQARFGGTLVDAGDDYPGSVRLRRPGAKRIRDILADEAGGQT